MSIHIARVASLTRSSITPSLFRTSLPRNTSRTPSFPALRNLSPAATPSTRSASSIPPPPPSSTPSPPPSQPQAPRKTRKWSPPLVAASVVALIAAAAADSLLSASPADPSQAHADEKQPPKAAIAAPAIAPPLVSAASEHELASVLPTSDIYKEAVAYAKSLQQSITAAIEDLEKEATPTSLFGESRKPAKFFQDSWTRPNNGGEGISAVIKEGVVLEKGGVNISIIQGKLPPAAVAQMRANHAGLEHVDKTQALPYAVVGLSIVLHPNNPMAPTCHFNFRYFEIYDSNDLSKPVASWFGGGSDLTPNYLFEEDATHFHSTLKAACDKNSDAYYPAFKTWCDKYFYIPHRKEARGVGGIFFDDLDSTSKIHTESLKYSSGVGPTPAELLAFVKDMGDAFVPSYVPILRKRYGMKFTEEQKRWQQLRRGRYVEFNLVNDRGTKFGLMTPGARIESVLMSLPTTAKWEYMTDMGAEGTEEGRLMDVLRTPRNWV